MNSDLIRRKDVEQMLTALGGCDASDEESRGWDNAIDAAMEGLRKIESASEKLLNYLIQCQNRELQRYERNGNLHDFTAAVAFSHAIGYIEELIEPYKED